MLWIVPLILKVRDIIFFSQAKHIMAHLAGFFERSRPPRKIPRNAPLYVLPQTKKNLKDFQNQWYIGIFTSLREIKIERETERGREREREKGREREGREGERERGRVKARESEKGKEKGERERGKGKGKREREREQKSRRFYF
jgi:hypothetical protein